MGGNVKVVAGKQTDALKEFIFSFDDLQIKIGREGIFVY
jgi:hypothetical protein